VRAFGQHVPGRVGELRKIEPDETGRVLGVGAQVPVEQRLDQGTQEAGIGRADEVDGAAHQSNTHDLPVEERIRQLARLEVHEPSPQPRVGRKRCLSLHTDEVLDHLHRGPVDPGQQVLPGKRCPVDGPQAQTLHKGPFLRCTFVHRH
jgi:hypothetical protein